MNYSTYLSFSVKEDHIKDAAAVVYRLKDSNFIGSDLLVLELSHHALIRISFDEERLDEFLFLFKKIVPYVDTYMDSFIGYMIDSEDHFYFYYVSHDKL